MILNNLSIYGRKEKPSLMPHLYLYGSNIACFWQQYIIQIKQLRRQNQYKLTTLHYWGKNKSINKQKEFEIMHLYCILSISFFYLTFYMAQLTFWGDTCHSPTHFCGGGCSWLGWWKAHPLQSPPTPSPTRSHRQLFRSISCWYYIIFITSSLTSI